MLAKLATSKAHDITSWEPPLPEEVSKMLDGYEILEMMGRGGMGVVYRGIQKSLNRPVALKLLPRELGSDPEFAARFEREAQFMAKLNHPHIVQIYEFGETSEGDWFIALELVEGGDLHQLINGDKKPSLEKIIRIMTQLCDVLSCAHENGLIHRDIKPTNILLTKEDQIKVADFGLSKRVDGKGQAPPEDFNLTLPEAVMGTAHYMAPEQSKADGVCSVDQRTDLYSLGVVFFELLTGETPRGTVKAPSEVVPACSKQVDRIVFKAMENDPDDRYQSALEMRKDLLKLRVGRQNWFHMLGTGLVAATLLVGAIYWSVGTAVDPSSSQIPDVPLSKPAGKNEPPPLSDVVSEATNQPFKNSLGMRFVPVPIVGGPSDGKRVLFSIWETRVSDFQWFAKERNFDWGQEVEFDQTADHPAIYVTWAKAVEFCEWLTDRERRLKRIGAGDHYRIPMDHEWSCAMGLGGKEDFAESPKAKDDRHSDFPWGNSWPPPTGVGNYYGEENRLNRTRGKKVLTGFQDSHHKTAPVGSYLPNSFGLYDLGGNVNEWCQDYYRSEEDGRKVLRGGSWYGSDQSFFRMGDRSRVFPEQKNSFRGFRCVLELGK